MNELESLRDQVRDCKARAADRLERLEEAQARLADLEGLLLRWLRVAETMDGMDGMPLIVATARAAGVVRQR
jgi:hypothetical protein